MGATAQTFRCGIARTLGDDDGVEYLRVSEVENHWWQYPPVEVSVETNTDCRNHNGFDNAVNIPKENAKFPEALEKHIHHCCRRSSKLVRLVDVHKVDAGTPWYKKPLVNSTDSSEKIKINI